MEHQSRCSHPQRAQSLDRFRKKRSARCFANQVRYGVRQEVALRYFTIFVKFGDYESDYAVAQVSMSLACYNT